MGKRGNGEGSIHKRKDDRWEGALTVGYTEKGNPKRVRVYGKTRAEVAEKLNKLLLEHQRGTLVLPKRLTVEAFVAEWLTFKADQVRETTLVGYKSALGRHVLPRIGSLPLQKVQPLHLQRIYSEMLKEGLSPRMCRLTHTIIHNAFKQAHRWELIARNPAEAADPPKGGTFKAHVWSGEEVLRFLAVAQTDRLYALWYLAVTTGMRRGELLGLRWEDVDWPRGCLTVERTLTVAEGRPVVSKPKTAKGQRRIYLSPEGIDVLSAHRKRQTTERAEMQDTGLWRDTGYLFTSSIGTPIDPNNLKRGFVTLADTAGVPRIRIHDLRHSYASLAALRGVPAKVLSARLGHATVGFTMEVYQHLYDEQHEAAALSLHDLIRPKKLEA